MSRKRCLKQIQGGICIWVYFYVFWCYFSIVIPFQIKCIWSVTAFKRNITSTTEYILLCCEHYFCHWVKPKFSPFVLVLFRRLLPSKRTVRVAKAGPNSRKLNRKVEDREVVLLNLPNISVHCGFLNCGRDVGTSAGIGC